MTRLITIFDKDLNQRVFRLFDENEIVHKIDTNLTISASSTAIDVGNNVELTGVLTDENSVPLGGMSVRILKNNVLVDTVTTNSSGVYSKIITGLDIGTYHFHTSYAGNDVYDNALSETIDVSVVGHTYAVTITADKQSMLTTESVTVSGTVTRDGTGYAGQSVRIFDGGVLVDTVTTDANGDYTKTVSNLTQGTHRFSSQFDVYESSIAVVEVVEHNYSINITADNPIIQSGDTSIITATLLDATDPVINESLSYTLTNKGTVVGSGSALTNSNGQITINYVGAGLGDIDVEVTYGTLLQETYEIKDTKFYDASSSGNVSNYATTTGVTFSYDSTNTAYLLSHSDTSSLTSIQLKNHTFSNTVTVEADIKLSSTATNVQCGIGLLNGNTSVNAKTTFYSPDSYYAVSLIESTKTSYGSNEVSSTDTHLNIQKEVWYRAKVIYNGSNVTFTLYNGDTVIGSVSATKSVLSTTSNELAIWVGFNNAKAYIKNIMVY